MVEIRLGDSGEDVRDINFKWVVRGELRRVRLAGFPKLVWLEGMRLE